MGLRRLNIVGVMSGTSLDGLDVALCEFVVDGNTLVSFGILDAHTFGYSTETKKWLSLMDSTAMELAKADFDFGGFIGEHVLSFLGERGLTAHLVASHGHTVFHQPCLGFTTQIGNGAAISAACGMPVVSDFRSMDVRLGGQGAPLVPIGDLLLFKEYDVCLNLGGIANISVKNNSGILAYDVCPANMPLNVLANRLGLPYDSNGDLARAGIVDKRLLDHLDHLDFYSLPYPKSLGKEWFDLVFAPAMDSFDISIEDKLATVSLHVASQIANEVLRFAGKHPKMLVTGGGAMNGFLMHLLKNQLGNACEVIAPDAQTIAFKEALVFAFLGLLRVQNNPNGLRSVTGARVDSIGGALYGDFRSLL